MSKETVLKPGQRSGLIPSLKTRWIIQVLHSQNSYHKNAALNLQRLWLTHYDHPPAPHWRMEEGRAILFSLCWNIYKAKSVIVETCVNTGTNINTYFLVSKRFCSITGKLKEHHALFFSSIMIQNQEAAQNMKDLQCVFDTVNGSPSTSAWREVVVTGFFLFFLPLCRVTITKQWERQCTLQRVTDFFVYLQNIVTRLTPSCRQPLSSSRLAQDYHPHVTIKRFPR